MFRKPNAACAPFESTPPDKVAGNASMLGTLNRVTLESEHVMYVPDPPPQPFPYWLGYVQLPPTRQSGKPFLPPAWNIEQTAIEPFTPNTLLLQKLKRIT